MKILINHIGYDRDYPKHGVILGKKGDNVTDFKVRDYESKKTVLEGKVKEIGPVNKWKDWYFREFDFNDLNDEGQYFIECKNGEDVISSFPFLVQKNLLERHTLSDIIFYLKGQRCSGLLDKADKNMIFDGNEGKTVDVHGGWYDASGDYSKHLSHLSYSTYFNPQQIPLTAWTLFKTFKNLSDRKDPNFKQFLRRLLDEALFGADFLVRIKNPTGSFYRTITGAGLEKAPEDRRIMPVMTAFDVRSEEDLTSGTDVYQKLKNNQSGSYEVGYRAGAGLSIAALAMASTFTVSGDYENENYLKAAEDAFDFLQRNNISLTNDGKENIVDDYCILIAATDLYNATKKDIYKKEADKRADNLINRIKGDAQYEGYFAADDKTRPFYHASDAGLPVVSLLHYIEIADDKDRIIEAVKKSLTFEMSLVDEVSNPFKYARQYVENNDGVRKSTFFYPHDSRTAPWWQGENARLASISAAFRMSMKYFKNDGDFYNTLKSHAASQLNWILGLNPFDVCMLDGSGRNNPEYLFFNNYSYANAPGGICNGITSGFYDEDDIDFNTNFEVDGEDHNWRWTEQWIPHGSWFMFAVSIGE